MAQQRTTSLRSIPLDLDVKQEAVINGIEMGVLITEFRTLLRMGWQMFVVFSVCESRKLPMSGLNLLRTVFSRKNDFYWYISS